MSEQTRTFDELGYGTVALPREGIPLFSLMLKEGGAYQLEGVVYRAFDPERPQTVWPPAKEGVVAGFTKGRTRDFDLNVGVSFAVGAAAALFGVKLPAFIKDLGAAFGVAFKDGRKLRATFDNLQQYYVFADTLRDTLEGRKESVRAEYVRKKLRAGDACVVFDQLKSTSFCVEALDGKSALVKGDLTVIKDVVGAHGNVGWGNEAQTEIEFDGAAPLVVAVKALKLAMDKDGSLRTGAQAGPPVKMMGPEAGGASPLEVFPADRPIFIVPSVG